MKNSASETIVPEGFDVQGLTFSDLADRFGTPLYIYDADRIESQVNRFRSAFSGIPLHIKFAMKSCANLSILRLMRRLGTGLDTVSIPEIQMGLRAGFAPADIVFTPNLVSFDEIRQAVKAGVAVTIENLSNLEKFGNEYGGSVPCAIRLSPHIISEAESGRGEALNRFALNKEHYSDAAPDRIVAWQNQSKFGIAMSLFDRMMEIIERTSININGIHIHSSHVIMSPDVFIKGARIVFDIARQFRNLEFFDLGGGISVAHKKEDPVMDLDDLGRRFATELTDFASSYGSTPDVWFEPGRFLISEAGFLLTRVDVVKNNGSIDFAGVDSGFNHLLRPMMYNAYHEIVNISNPRGPLKTYTVVGNLCEIDNLGENRELNVIRENDLLLIKNAGAYGFCMSSQYNARLRPAEVLIVDGQAHLIRRRETMEDLLRNQVEIDTGG